MKGIWKAIICVLVASMFVMPATNIPIKKQDQAMQSYIEDGKNNPRLVNSARSTTKGDETEYWAVLIAVGEYAEHPDENRPSMLEAVDNLYDTLLESEHWQQDHIKVLKGMECTALNIVNALKWLADNDDENDVSLVYITTHGIQGPDIPPFDEDDGQDEYIVTYYGFEYPFTCIWDDELNFLISRLDSQGIAVIIDSCHSGGVGDSTKRHEWANETMSELEGDSRVVLMSCAEDELSYGSYFTNYIVKGLKGYADSNYDGFCSAEEAFEYAEPLILELADALDVQWQPQLYDGYAGELPLTEQHVYDNDTLDQQQTTTTNNGWVMLRHLWLAQGFKPTLNTLTRIELMISCYDNPPDDIEITVSIRNSLTGEDLTSGTIMGTEVAGWYGWTNIDVPNIEVSPGETYYIICRDSDPYSSGGGYAWYFDVHNPYTRGDAWRSLDSGISWELADYPSQPETDFCFKTYGK